MSKRFITDENLNYVIDKMNNILNAKCSFEYLVKFNYWGDYWYISDPIPCINAQNRNITISSNVQNLSASFGKPVISGNLFEVRRHKDSIILATNDRDTAGYLFNQNPGIVWTVTINFN